MQNWFLLFVLLSSTCLRGQDTTQVLFLDGLATPERLILRWGTNSTACYERGKANGYLLQKATQNRPEFVLVTKVSPLANSVIDARLRTHVDDEAAFVAAHILRTSLDSLYPTEGGDLLAASEQHNQRLLALNFLMLAADLSATAADILGMRHVIDDYKPEQKALYRLIVLDDQGRGADTAHYYYAATPSLLPPITDLRAEQRGQRVHLHWDYASNAQFYTAYDLLRAEQATGPFRRLTTQPIYTADAQARSNIHIDSVELGKTYYYRVQGHSSFGVKGPVSATLTQRVVDQRVGFTALNARAEGNHEAITLRWEPKLAVASPGHLMGVRVYKANSLDGQYQALHPGYLPVYTNTFRDTMIRNERDHYYRIVAYNSDQVERSSAPILATYIDTLAPAKPADLFGYVDTAGIARIIWQPNNERDLAGYRVYQSNRPDGTFYHCHDLLHHSHEFTDTVGLQFLDKAVYYKVTAVDYNNNHSPYSALLTLARPDTIAPVPARITNYQLTDRNLTLHWLPSSSEDVVQTYVLRQATDRLDTLRIPFNSTTYTDTLPPTYAGRLTYCLVVEDAAGNQRSGNTISTHVKAASVLPRLAIVKTERGYHARTAEQRAAGEVLYLYLDVAGQPMQYLDRLDHQVTDYPLPKIRTAPFRLAAYLLDGDGRKSEIFYSNSISQL
ncbi:MAG: hypothetical protein AAGJ82_06355 [Bacteroidota bacterium]